MAQVSKERFSRKLERFHWIYFPVQRETFKITALGFEFFQSTPLKVQMFKIAIGDAVFPILFYERNIFAKTRSHGFIAVSPANNLLGL